MFKTCQTTLLAYNSPEAVLCKPRACQRCFLWHTCDTLWSGCQSRSPLTNRFPAFIEPDRSTQQSDTQMLPPHICASGLHLSVTLTQVLLPLLIPLRTIQSAGGPQAAFHCCF